MQIGLFRVPFRRLLRRVGTCGRFALRVKQGRGGAKEAYYTIYKRTQYMYRRSVLYSTSYIMWAPAGAYIAAAVYIIIYVEQLAVKDCAIRHVRRQTIK